MKTLIEKGKKYKRIKKLKSEKEAKEYLEKLKAKNIGCKSKRFQPFIDLFDMPLFKGSKFGIHHFDIYVPMDWND